MPSVLSPIDNTPFVGGSPPGIVAVDSSGLQQLAADIVAIDGKINVGADTAPAYVIVCTGDMLITNSGTIPNPYVVIGESGAITNAKNMLLQYFLVPNYGAIQCTHNGVAYTNLCLQPSGGNVGVGQYTAAKTVDILHASSAQLRLTQSAGTTYADMQVDASGILRIQPSGTATVCHGTSAGTELELLRLRNSSYDANTAASLSFSCANADTTTQKLRGIYDPVQGYCLDFYTFEMFLNFAARINGQGFVGINTLTPARRCEILDGSGDAQFRITHTASTHYTELKTVAGGWLVIIPEGYGPGAIVGILNTRSGDDTFANLSIDGGTNSSNSLATFIMNGSHNAAGFLDKMSFAEDDVNQWNIYYSSLGNFLGFNLGPAAYTDWKMALHDSGQVQFADGVSFASETAADATVDFAADGNKQKHTTSGAVAFTLTAPAGPANCQLKIIYGGAHTPSFTTTVKWPSATEPTWTATAGKTDIVMLYWDGTAWWGAALLNYTT